MNNAQRFALGMMMFGASWTPALGAQGDPGEALRVFMESEAVPAGFSGTVLLARSDTVLYRGAFGPANRDFGVPNRVDTKFNLGSMNKMFTSVAIAQLIEEGHLSFDDPLSDFIDFPDRASAEQIQIKHLLSHTSGLGSYFNQRFFDSSRARFRTVDQMLDIARDETLQFPPGSRWQYSNTGMLVLGAVIEKVTGQDYFEYIREHVYRPAGMEYSDSYELDRVVPNLAVGYDPVTEDGVTQYRNNLFTHVIRGGPAGGGYSTVDDLFAFTQTLQSGGLVGEALVRVLLSAKPDLNSPDYGFGFGVDANIGTAGHSGGFPGISSNLDMFVESGYTAVVLSNISRGAVPIVQKIRELVAAENGG